MKIAHFPNRLCRVLIPLLERIQDKLATKPATRSTDLPKIRGGHLLKVLAGCPELRPVKYRFTLDQLAEHSHVLGCGSQVWLHIASLPYSRRQRPVNDLYLLSLH